MTCGASGADEEEAAGDTGEPKLIKGQVCVGDEVEWVEVLVAHERKGRREKKWQNE